MIKTNNLLKIFNKNKSNEVRAINGVSIELPEKGLVAIYGTSGSGKTTLMNALGGLDKFNGGEIIMNGNVYKSRVDDKFRIANIGYVFQNYLLDEKLDVYQNVAQGLRTVGVKNEEEIFNRVMTALDNVGMRDYFKRNVTTLSGGQQQRVAIARAMVKGAKIILADEPTGNLDEINTRTVMQILKALSANCLVIVVTHEEDLIEKYADSVIEIKDGKVENMCEGGSLYHEGGDKTRVFLGGKKKSKLTAENVDIDYYGELSPVHITIVNDKGKIYLKTDGNVRVVDESSEIKFEDKTEKQFIEEQREKTYGAMNFLSNIEAGKTGKVFSFKSSFAEGIKSLVNKKKKFTLFTVSVFVIMIAVVIFMGVLGTYIYSYQTVGSDFPSDLVKITVSNAKDKAKVDAVIEKYGYKIDNEYLYSTAMSNAQLNLVGFETLGMSYWSNNEYVYNDIEKTKKMKWLYGSADDLDSYYQIVISRGLADSALAGWTNNSGIEGMGYDLICTRTMQMNMFINVQIAGVVDDDDITVYASKLLWNEVLFRYELDSNYGEQAADGEALVPEYSSYKDGEIIEIMNKDFTVRKSPNVNKTTINANEMLALEDRFTSEMMLMIYTPDADELANSLLGEGKIESEKVLTRAIVYEDNYKREIANIKICSTIIASLMGLMLLTTFWMFFAALSNKVKEIGLYRAIGVSSANIVYKFFIEFMAMVLVCVVSVYIVIGLPILIFSNGILLYFPLWLYFASMLGIIACMCLISLLPILFFIRKTPMQILAKYDL